MTKTLAIAAAAAAFIAVSAGASFADPCHGATYNGYTTYNYTPAPTYSYAAPRNVVYTQVYTSGY